ncbi:SH3 domain-containing protein [Agrobacterium vitis]|nr:SH3 domain-containing protein [Agrobacterium vitis]NTA31761.1 SH3 domain-containing protein [Agrobacterium vitis]
MSKRVWLGWGIAAVCALGWATSDPKTSHPPGSSQTAIQVQPSPMTAAQSASSTKNPTLPPPPTTPQADPKPDTLNDEPVVLFTLSDAKLRQSPSKTAAVIWTVPKNTAVVSLAQASGWHRVQVSQFTGWIQGSALGVSRPAAVKPKSEKSLKEPIVPVRPLEPTHRAGQPMRDPYVGTCDCPYDLMRNGRACGGRSAYSRPGGRSPQCYF